MRFFSFLLVFLEETILYTLFVSLALTTLPLLTEFIVSVLKVNATAPLALANLNRNRQLRLAPTLLARALRPDRVDAVQPAPVM